jgi:hypothetical protein
MRSHASKSGHLRYEGPQRKIFAFSHKPIAAGPKNVPNQMTSKSKSVSVGSSTISSSSTNSNSEFQNAITVYYFAKHWISLTLDSFAREMQVPSPNYEMILFNPNSMPQRAAYYQPRARVVMIRRDLLIDMYLWNRSLAQKFWSFTLAHEIWHYIQMDIGGRLLPQNYPSQEKYVEHSAQEMASLISGVDEKTWGTIFQQFVASSKSKWIQLPNGDLLSLGPEKVA